MKTAAARPELEQADRMRREQARLGRMEIEAAERKKAKPPPVKRPIGASVV